MTKLPCNSAALVAIAACSLAGGAENLTVATFLRMLDLGVDRIYTDDPRLLLRLKNARRFHAVACEGHFAKHLQGICTNDRDAIYWSFTDQLVKTDPEGKVLKQIPVASHHGDLCHVDGKLFVAVNLGQFNQPAGKADSWVYVYHAGSLEELARHRVPEAVHGAGGIAWHDGRFLAVGGLPPGAEENYLYEYDPSFRFLGRSALPSGYTLMGIQTVAFAENYWWFGCYGDPKILLKADPSLRLVRKWQFDGSLGIVGLADGRFLVAEGKSSKENGCTGAVRVAVPDQRTGLRTE
ncbi:MAG: hypothetical protein ACYC6Y_11440 [Thermoguttaceae bacterium]